MARELTIRIKVADSDQARAALESVEKGLEGVEKAGGSVAKSIGEEKGDGGTGVVGALKTLQKVAVAYGITQAIERTVEWGGRLTDLSASTGITVEALQKLAFVGGQSGVSVDQLARGVQMLQRRLAGNDESAVNAVQALGLSVQDLLAMTPDKMFEALAVQVGKIPDPAQRTLAAFQLLGRQGSDLIPVLTSDVKGLGDSFTGMSESAVRGLDILGDTWDRIKLTTLSFVGEVVGGVASGLEAMQMFAIEHGLTWQQMVTSVITTLWRIKTAIDAAIGWVMSLPATVLNAKNQVVTYAQQMYAGVYEWLVGKFQGVVDAAKGKVDAITGFFADMYKKVVGGSYVPDMVIEVGQWVQQLQPLMVEPIQRQTKAVESAFAQMQRNISNSFTQWGNNLSGWVSSAIPGIFGKGLGAIASGLLSSVGTMLTGGLNKLVSMGVDLAWKGLQKLGSWIAGLFGGGNDTKKAREQFAEAMGFGSLDQLYKKLQSMGPAGEALANVGLNVIGKKDTGANQQWMNDVSAFLRPSTSDLFGATGWSGADTGMGTTPGWEVPATGGVSGGAGIVSNVTINLTQPILTSAEAIRDLAEQVAEVIADDVRTLVRVR